MPIPDEVHALIAGRPLTVYGKRCEHTTRAYRTIGSNGVTTYRMRCTNCGTITRNLSVIDEPWLRTMNLPIWVDNSDIGPPCIVCGDKPTELHHWAPVHLFNGESEMWPTSYLCKRHHAEWHARLRQHR